jgi:DNA-binding NarL/FixJ family response regulator
MNAQRPPTPPEPSVLIVDDHELIGNSLMRSLRAEGLSAHHHDGRRDGGVPAAAAALPPGLALLDLDLGRDRTGQRLDGTGLVAPLCSAGWRVLILSGNTDHARIGAALAQGAAGWVPKNAPFPALLEAIRRALAGEEVMAPARRQRLIDVHEQLSAQRRELAVKLDRLTRREREVLADLAQGLRAQGIADKYVVSLTTVRSQIRAVLAKLEVASQLEAVALYRRAG